MTSVDTCHAISPFTVAAPRIVLLFLEMNNIQFILNIIQSQCYLHFVEAVDAEKRTARSERDHPLLQMKEEDLDFVLQFVLASGSLKEMARLHGVSYPTIRATLDRVIASLQDRVSGRPPDPLTELLASLVERGEIKVVSRAVGNRAQHQDSSVT